MYSAPHTGSMAAINRPGCAAPSKQRSLPSSQKVRYPSPEVDQAVWPEGKDLMPSCGSMAPSAHLGSPSGVNTGVAPPGQQRCTKWGRGRPTLTLIQLVASPVDACRSSGRGGQGQFSACSDP